MSTSDEPLVSEVVTPANISAGSETSAPEEQMETITAPAKVMRIGSMVKQLLEEAHGTRLDEASRERMAEIYERSIVELGEALSPDLQEELKMLALPFTDGEIPSEAEIRVAQEVPFRTGQFTNTGGTAGLVNPFTTIERKDVGIVLKEISATDETPE